MLQDPVVRAQAQKPSYGGGGLFDAVCHLYKFLLVELS
jgi:hypothetical protein